MLFWDRLSPRIKKASWMFSILVFVFFIAQIIRSMYVPDLPVPVTSLVRSGATVLAIRIPATQGKPQEEILINYYVHEEPPRAIIIRQPVRASRIIDEDRFRATTIIDLNEEDWLTIHQLREEWCMFPPQQEETDPTDNAYEIGIRCPDESSSFNSKGISLKSDSLPVILKQIMYSTEKK